MAAFVSAHSIVESTYDVDLELSDLLLPVIYADD